MNETRELFQVLTRRFGLLNKNCCSALEEDVSLVQSHILYEIQKQPDSSMQDVSERLGMDITTFSRQIQTLIKRELVMKNASPSDKRTYLLTLTDKGEQVAEEIDRQMGESFDMIFSSMTTFEKNAVQEAIRRLNEAMLTSDRCCR